MICDRRIAGREQGKVYKTIDLLLMCGLEMVPPTKTGGRAGVKVGSEQDGRD